MSHSKGNWKIGLCGSVVTDNGDGFETTTGHNEIDYYGGYLIAESILKPDDAKLISAAPDLLNACIMSRNAIAFLAQTSDAAKNTIVAIDAAIDKARN